MLVPNTASVVGKFIGVTGLDLEGLTWYLTFYVRDTSMPWTVAQLTRLADYFNDWFALGKNGGAPAKDAITSAWLLKTTTARDLGAVGGNVFHYPAVDTQAARAGTPYAPSAPALVQYRGDVGGEPTHGWIFWSGAVETDITADAVDSAYRTLVDARMEDFRADLNDPINGGTVSWAQVIVSRHSGTHVWGSDPDDPPLPKLPNKRATAETNTLSSIAVRSAIGAQRNRRKLT